MTTLTIGGLPPTADPVKEHGQELGRAIVNLSSSDKDVRRAAYIKYYGLRRLFTEDQLKTFESSLDGFRAQHNHKALTQILEEVRCEVGLLSQRKEPDMAKEKAGTTVSPVKKFTAAIIAGLKSFIEAAEALDEMLPVLTGAVPTEAPPQGKAAGEKEASAEPSKTEEKPPEEKPAETKKEPAKTVDAEQLRKDCVALISDISKKLKKEGQNSVDKLRALFKGFGVKGVGAAPEEMLPEIKEALEKLLNE